MPYLVIRDRDALKYRVEDRDDAEREACEKAKATGGKYFIYKLIASASEMEVPVEVVQKPMICDLEDGKSHEPREPVLSE